MTNPAETNLVTEQVAEPSCLKNEVTKPADGPEDRKSRLPLYGVVAICGGECPYFYDTSTDDHYQQCFKKATAETEKY